MQRISDDSSWMWVWIHMTDLTLARSYMHHVINSNKPFGWRFIHQLQFLYYAYNVSNQSIMFSEWESNKNEI